MPGEKMDSAVQPALSPEASKPDPAFEAAVYRKVTFRLIPFLFLCYIFAYVDRVNVGFAKLQMQRDLHMSNAVYGFGSGIFFLGYLLFQVPCNLALQKIGAKYWLGPIMIVWGFVSACTMFAINGYTFYALRFLLGVVESGFFPGVILYLTFWYPSKHRAKMVAAFMTAIPLSGLIGGPISGWLLDHMSAVGGLRAWQWLFVIEAIPSVIAGVLTMWFLQDSPARAKWLKPVERDFLLGRLTEDESTRKSAMGDDHHHSFAGALRSRNVWLFCLMYFGTVMGNYGLQFWLPQIIQDTLTKDPLKIGFYTMIPWGTTAIVMVLVGRHSDATGERAWHVAMSAAAGGLGLALSAIPGISGGFGLFALTIATAGIISASASFWSLPTMYLSGAAASGGIALINSIGNLGGQVGPYLIGQIKQWTNSMTPALFTLACGCWVSAMLTLYFFRKRRSPTA
jgi:MFS family permease